MRSETSPDDVHGMAKSVGILTSTGGLASHAAVVARGWDIPAVVGAVGVVVGEGMVAIGDETYREGDVLSIDGSSGEVFGGAVTTVEAVVPEAATLLAWAQELGIRIGDEHDAGAEAADIGEAEGAVSNDDVVRALAIKGYAMADMLGLALGVSAEEAAALVERLTADGIAKDLERHVQPHRRRQDAGCEMIAADNESSGRGERDSGARCLHRPRPSDESIVTAWQMKQVAGEQVLNDHARRRLRCGRAAQRLSELHLETSESVDPRPCSPSCRAWRLSGEAPRCRPSKGC